MDCSEFHEDMRRGTADFPVEWYYVDEAHPRYQMPFHWHLDYELIHVRSGRFTLFLNGRRLVLGAGDSAWITGGVIHGGMPEDCLYECVVFDQSVLTLPSGETAGSSFSGLLPQGSALARQAGALCAEMEEKRRGSTWAVLGLIWQMLGLLQRQEPACVPSVQERQELLWLKRVLIYLRSHYGETLTLTELAGVADLSPRYFCRAFKAMTGRTPIDYLLYYRVERAGERLQLTDESITDIAFACGFNDVSYFSRIFKRYKGVSPSAHRHAHRAEQG